MTVHLVTIGIDKGMRQALDDTLQPEADIDAHHLGPADAAAIEGLDILVVGPESDAPIQAAQRLVRGHAQVRTLFLVAPEQVGTLKPAVLTSPFLGASAAVLPLDEPDKLATEVQRAVHRARKSRRGQAMIRMAQQSLGAAPQTDAPGRSMVDVILQRAPIGIVMVDSRSRVVGWNEAARAVTGRNEREVLGMPLADALGASDRTISAESEDRDGVQIVGAGGQTRIIDIKHGEVVGPSDGTRLVMIHDVTGRVQAEKRLRRLLDELEDRVAERTREVTRTNELLMEEIEERRRAQEDLVKSEMQLLEAEKTANVGSWEQEVGTDSARFSRELFNILGVEMKQTPPTVDAVVRAVHPDDRPRFRESLEGLSHGPSLIDLDHRIVRPDGEVRTVHTRLRYVGSTEDRQPRLLGTVQDITDRVRLEEEQRRLKERERELEQLREINQMKTTFVNTTAHELSTPLTPVLAQLYLLRDRYAAQLPEEAQRSIDILDRNLQRLRRLVRDVLDVVRLDTGSIQIEPRAVDVAEVAAEVYNTYKDPCKEAGITLSTDLDSVGVSADPDRLHQVLHNLLHNAQKFTEKGDTISVQVTSSNDHAIIEIADDGAGLDPEQTTHIFEPFAQAENARDRTDGGTGLGLHIVKGIIEAHGGTVTCHSDGPGKGATFVVTLPKPKPDDDPDRALDGLDQ